MTSFVRRLRTASMLAASVAGFAVPQAMGQISSSVRLSERGLPINPSPSSTYFTYDCEYPVPFLNHPIIGGLSWNFSGNTNGNFSAQLTAEFATTLEQLALNALQEGISQFIPDSPCTFGIEQDLGVLRGSVNLYSFSIGGGSTGGFEVNRKARAAIDFADFLDITAETATTIELPVSISGSVLAAESFGDPTRTKATAVLRMSGSLGLQGFFEEVAVESATVIPTQASINVTRVIQLSLQPGVTSVPILVSASAEAEATAVSAGFFGTISGAATAGVSFPNSVHIKTFRAPGGGPLPAGVTIRSRNLGRVLQTSVVPCYPNCDASATPPILNVSDFICFLNKFAAADPYANCDSSTNPPTLNVADFICFLNRFAAGCP